MRSRKAITWSVVAVIVLTVVGVVAAVRRASPVSSGDEIPISRVKRGDLEMKVFANGELRAIHSETLTAPPIGGGSLQITYLMQTGTAVKKGDLVMAFDPTEQRYKLEQNRSELLQAEQEITKARADAAVTAAQDKVALLKARYDVRRAQLDVQKNELVSTIDARKNDLALEQANRVLAELEQDVKSRDVSGQATIALAEEKRNKAKLQMDQAQSNIDKMRVTAPMDGLIFVNKNHGDFYFTGMSVPDYREGDQVDAGRAIAQVIDAKQMQVIVKVGELERNNVKEGRPVDIRLDALPGETLHGTVKIVGGSNVNRMFWDDDTSTKFEVTIELGSGAGSQLDPRLRPGMTAAVLIDGEPQKNVLYVPRQALFLKDNKRIVYMKNGNTFAARDVKIDAENESQAAIEGIGVGTEVALIDPTAPRKATSPSGGVGVGGGTL
ncbi:MAG TPA: efflux RND transporter periplasmic adaptor subunit [Verrucomicrobiae bacterium]|nr:efflux RND transporter periplasmic adaptor subunit [Verrucomicrobiae bacterium]